MREAANPQQYDLPRTNWLRRGAEDSLSRRRIRASLASFVPKSALQGKSVIDIGSGTGHLFPWFTEHGAKRIVGIDPSIRNVEASSAKYADVQVYPSTLNQFASVSREKFDTAFAIFVLEHIENLGEAFKNISSILSEGGKLYLATGNPLYELSAAKGGRIIHAEVVDELQNGAREVRVERRLDDGSTSTIYDILRPTDLIAGAAQEMGFTLEREGFYWGPHSPKNGKPVFHMLEFSKDLQSHTGKH